MKQSRTWSGSMSDTRYTSQRSSICAMAAALWPPRRKSRCRWSTTSRGVRASCIHFANVSWPSPSAHEPTSTMTPPSFTGCFALSSAFCSWYRFRSFGAPPWLTTTTSAYS